MSAEKILGALAKQEKMRYTELSGLVGHTTTTSRALKAMESSGLIKRQVLDEPYRPVSYSLTERGRKLKDLVTQIEKL